MIRRWTRGLLKTQPGDRLLYLRRGFKGIYRRLVDRTRFSVNQRLERAVLETHPATLLRHHDIATWAEDRARQHAEIEGSVCGEFVARHRSFMRDLTREFAGRWSHSSVRVLIHSPPPEKALAWASNMKNILDCLRFMGIAAERHAWDAPIEASLTKHRPNVFLTIWHDDYLRRINWSAITEYRAQSELLVGINAPEEELYGRDLVRELIRWSKKHGISFFFKDRPREYVSSSYGRFWDAGYDVVALEYGANPLVYRPVEEVAVDIDYCFLGSLHRDKWSRYLAYFRPILKGYRGFLLGPGWPTGPQKTLPPRTHRFIYARASAGLNLHHETQLKLPVELNERTYNLASAGIPQVIDSPLLLPQRFTDEMVFRADTPADYLKQFNVTLEDPCEARRRALNAHDHVLRHHTMFHRLSEFLADLNQVQEKRARASLQ